MIMAYGYMRPDPVEQFRNTAGHYKLLISTAMEEGFTRAEAIELLKVYALSDVACKLDGISF